MGDASGSKAPPCLTTILSNSMKTALHQFVIYQTTAPTRKKIHHTPIPSLTSTTSQTNWEFLGSSEKIFHSRQRSPSSASYGISHNSWFPP